MKWTKCSKKMPTDRKPVILWDADVEQVTSGHYSHDTDSFYSCGHVIENEVTHWCMLPNPPEQEG